MDRCPAGTRPRGLSLQFGLQCGFWQGQTPRDLSPHAHFRAMNVRPAIEERFLRPAVMGVVNVTPDSFSDGGVNYRAEDAVASARRMLDEGAAIVDVGGESTRPGSEGVGLDEELRRVVPVLEALGTAPPSRSTPRRPRSRGARSRSGPSSSTTSPRSGPIPSSPAQSRRRAHTSA